jgi:hypothetical protein
MHEWAPAAAPIILDWMCRGAVGRVGARKQLAESRYSHGVRLAGAAAGRSWLNRRVTGVRVSHSDWLADEDDGGAAGAEVTL